MVSGEYFNSKLSFLIGAARVLDPNFMLVFRSSWAEWDCSEKRRPSISRGLVTFIAASIYTANNFIPFRDTLDERRDKNLWYSAN